MELSGYCFVNKKTTTGMSAIDISNFEGKVCRVMEFANDCVLILDSAATGIASFDMCDIGASFKCFEYGEIIYSTELNEIEKMLYTTRCMMRKGGYNNIVKNMVIQASLHYGKFNDNVLWQVENEENEERAKAEYLKKQ
jgi:Cu2+-containing amine oxidase